MKTMKHFILLIAALLALVLVSPPASAQVVPGAKPVMSAFGGAPTFVASNMTTNVTCGAVVLQRGQGLALWTAHKTVTNQATTLVVSFELSTNAAGSTVTNWFRPTAPLTVTFTNHSGIATNYGYALIPPTSVDQAAQIRPWAFQNTATTNGWSNFTFAASVIVP